MEASELRIGNWVSVDTATGGWWVDHHITAWDFHKSAAGTLLCEAAEPIPLTEKWLVDFGFKKFEPTGSLALLYIKSIHEFDLKKLVIYFDRTYFTVAFADYYTGKEKTELFPMKYKYIHQLQNLFFAITGKELEIIKDAVPT